MSYHKTGTEAIGAFRYKSRIKVGSNCKCWGGRSLNLIGAPDLPGNSKKYSKHKKCLGLVLRRVTKNEHL